MGSIGASPEALGKPTARHIMPDDEIAMCKFVDGMVSAFRTTALTTTFISEMDNTPPPYPSPLVDLQRVRGHIGPAITSGAHEGAEIVEAGNYSAVAVWESPTYRGKPFSDTATGVAPLRFEWRTRVRQAKEKYLGTISTQDDVSPTLKPHYHLQFLGRNPNVPSVPGAISAVITPYLERAKRENVAAWLEATTDQAIKVYTHFGFRVVETIFIGVGKRNSDGWPEEGGTGVPGTCMVFDAHLRA